MRLNLKALEPYKMRLISENLKLKGRKKQCNRKGWNETGR
jgi:hypothetical protein